MEVLIYCNHITTLILQMFVCKVTWKFSIHILLQGAQEHFNIIFHKVINYTEWLGSEDYYWAIVTND